MLFHHSHVLHTLWYSIAKSTFPKPMSVPSDRVLSRFLGQLKPTMHVKGALVKHTPAPYASRARKKFVPIPRAIKTYDACERGLSETHPCSICFQGS